MAYRYSDGFGSYYLNGVKVTKEIALTPARDLDVQLVLTESNVDVQKQIINKIGIERVIQKLGMPSLDKWVDPNTDKSYELFHLKSGNLDRRYLFYEHASVPGMYYARAVPPEVSMCWQARAWIVGVIERDEINSCDEIEAVNNLPKYLS
jgi:hypothetical protein